MLSMPVPITLLYVVVVLIALTPGPVRAGAVDYSWGLDPDEFGYLSQADLAGCGLAGSGCGPAAAVNSFVYMQNTYRRTYGDSLVPTQPEPKTDFNNDGRIDRYDDWIYAAKMLAEPPYMKTCCGSSTLRNDFFYGKRRYIEDRVPGKTVYQAMDDPELNALDPQGNFGGADVEIVRSPPTPQFFSENLKSGEDIEVLITQDDGVKLTFGHFVTLYALRWIDQDMSGNINAADGMASLSYLDPSKAPSDQEQTRELRQRADGRLFLIGANGQEYDIRFAVKESPMDKNRAPAPGTLILLITGLGALAAAWAWRRS